MKARRGPDTTLQWRTPTELPMAHSSQIEQIAERVERLLVRHDELQRTNALLVEQVNSLTQERDSLKSRSA